MKRPLDEVRPRPLRFAYGLDLVRRLPLDTRELERKIIAAYRSSEKRAA